MLLCRVLLSASLLIGNVKAQQNRYPDFPRPIRLIGDSPDYPYPLAVYHGQVASSWDRMDHGFVANLMLPPEDSLDLCNYPNATVAMEGNSSTENIAPGVEERIVVLPPAELEGNDNYDAIFEELLPSNGDPIALLVSMKGCTAEKKARIVRSMQLQLSAKIKYLIIHGKDENEVGLEHLVSESFTESLDLDSVGIVFVPFQFGTNMRLVIAHWALNRSSNPYLFQSNNAEWGLQIELAARPPALHTHPDFDTNDGGGVSMQENYKTHFYWFRLTLFIVLILSPCVRAGYLWYANGGRFHWRRNERGRIIGIQYIPPMPHWLSNGQEAQRGSPVSATLSEEEFNALPEIHYQPPPPGERGCGDDDDETITKTAETSADGGSLAVEEKTPGVLSGDAAAAAAAASTVDGSTTTTASTTTSNTCSICIDDFEAGEKVILLPKCRHAFHRDCIKPWLMERQGCCPVCKTAVAESEENDDETNLERINEAPGTTTTTTTTEAGEEALERRLRSTLETFHVPPMLVSTNDRPR